MEHPQLSLQCECTPIADTQYDLAGAGSPTHAVVRAIAAASDTNPTSLPPLNEYIDPEALDRMFDEASENDGPSGRIFSFTVNGWNVFVRDDGRIRICDPTETANTSPIFD
ncbi:HalOD1 output domain-containing protein [Halomicrococcus sp. NG-SE-24]|uniref:HalOD1 output domain-containing protein n=1 Tax=Halomicrococcus sp. NG-SE-24 TaxID=3436928 RepID=UPI003D952B87